MYRTKLGASFAPCLPRMVDALICGVPMPFSAHPGFAPCSGAGLLQDIMRSKHGGLSIIEGLGGHCPAEAGAEWTPKRHSPNVRLCCPQGGVPEILKEMRAAYRRRIKTSRRKWGDVVIEHFTGRDFSPEDYSLYLRLADKARVKREFLPAGFFREMPLEHIYIGARVGKERIGWVLLVADGRKLYFLFAGLGPQNKAYDTYKNLIWEMVQYACDQGYHSIDLGTGAETAKARLGGEMEEIFSLVTHKSRLINHVLKRFPFFEYRARYTQPNVFRE